MRFYLGTHLPAWLATTAEPLFVSAIRLRRRKRPWPKAAGPWALDSGGFSELNKTGRWTVTPTYYAGEVRRWRAEMGGMQWAAVQDWMCEPFVVAKTGLSVAEHQRRTIASYHDLTALAPEIPWVPVLQGWQYDDYLSHVEQYRAAGVDLAALPLVGLGSVCRRQHTRMAEQLIRELHGAGIRIHGFGFKLDGLRRCARWLASADSLAWSFQARREWNAGKGRRMCRGTHPGGCANCKAWATAWRVRVLAAVAVGHAVERRPTLFDGCGISASEPHGAMA